MGTKRRRAKIRAEALAEMRQTMSVIEIADAMGITRQQVYRLLDRTPSTEVTKRREG